MSEKNTPPLLTIAVPTKDRVDLLERCLESIAGPYSAGEVELVVSDNSTAPDTEQLVAGYSHRWGRSLRYFRNSEGTGFVENFNLCYTRARGRYTLILHDDDYLLPGAVDTILGIIRDANEQHDQVLLFGVRVEKLSGSVLRRQYARKDTYLPPAEALYRLLGNSSFVRTPGLVVRTDAYAAVGGFWVDSHRVVDFCIEVRLFGRYGVRRLPATTAAYTVHEGGLTTTAFNPRTVALNEKAFDIARQLGVLDETVITERQRHWFHQFILGGAWRALRRRDRATARQVLSLFQLRSIKALGPSPRWLPVRVVFSLLAGSVWPACSRRPEGDVGHGSSAARDGDPDRPVAKQTARW